MKYDTIVIGTGLGGSSAAALLAHYGLKVLILERNPRIGGSCSNYKRKGCTIDVGTHMFCRGHRGPFGRIQRRLGLRQSQQIKFVQAKYLSEVIGFGVHMHVPRSPLGLPKFLVGALKELRLKPHEVPQVIRFFRDIITMHPVAVDELDTVNMKTFMMRYTDNPRLLAIFGFLLGLYFIMPIHLVSAGEAIWAFQRMVKDNALSYPMGGAIQIPRTILDAARRDGAVLRTRSGAKKIEKLSSGMFRVITEDGRSYQSRSVVSTTSLLATIFGLVGEEHFPEAYVQRIRSLKGSAIAVQTKILLDRPVVKAGSLVGGFSKTVDFDNLEVDDFEKLYGDLEQGHLTRITPIYGPVPSNHDPSLAPSGKQLITVCAVAPTSDVPLHDKPQAWIDGMHEALEGMKPEIYRHIEWKEDYSVQFIEAWIGKPGGPAVSTGQTTDQVGVRRPPVRTPVPGLYVAGCGAGGRGVGTELAASSGMEAADALFQDQYNHLI